MCSPTRNRVVLVNAGESGEVPKAIVLIGALAVAACAATPAVEQASRSGAACAFGAPRDCFDGTDRTDRNNRDVGTDRSDSVNHDTTADVTDRVNRDDT